ncbi:MAG TPA: phosphoribosylglycinamide formyltransferase [Clostridiaceae bacterium]|nr:phosphoribosylglycinamide formyltransferase [Clostridiaceae bacterium]
MYRIAVLISGTGSNLKALIEESQRSNLFEIVLVIADRDAKGIQHAKNAGIEHLVLDRKRASLSDDILQAVRGVDLIVLAGFLSILKGDILKAYRDRIINIHPSLLPAFGGEGMYGLKVHQAVLKDGKEVSGCTVHYVDEAVDGGKMIIQNIVSTKDLATGEELQARVLVEEHIALCTAVSLLALEHRN